MGEKLKISIIIPTINRYEELLSAIRSVENQQYKSIELIIVDQNKDDSIYNKLNHLYRDFPYKVSHYRVSFKGASEARNFGVKKADGALCFFMDDDAELLDNTLLVATKYMNDKGCDGIFGRCVDRNLKSTVTNFDHESAPLLADNYESKFVESTLLIKTDIIRKFPFDEEFGAGRFYGAEEAHDLVLRLLKEKKNLFYSPDIMIYHPNKIDSYRTNSEIWRAYTYRCGFGRLCRKHRLYTKYYKRLLKVCLIIPYCIFFKKNKLRFYFAEFLGLLCGFVLPGIE